MRYPKPGGWISRGGVGKTRLRTWTVDEGLASKCGMGVVDWVIAWRTGRGRAETICVGLKVAIEEDN